MQLAVNKDCGLELIEHPLYLHDFGPLVFYLFLLMKKELNGKYFATEKDVIDSFNIYLEEKIESSTRRYSEALRPSGNNSTLGITL